MRRIGLYREIRTYTGLYATSFFSAYNKYNAPSMETATTKYIPVGLAHKMVAFSRDKHRRTETLRRALDRRQCPDVKTRSLQHARAHELQRHSHQKARREEALFASQLDDLLGQGDERGEGGIQHHRSDRGVPFPVQQGRGSAHTPAPERDAGGGAACAKEFHHALE